MKEKGKFKKRWVILPLIILLVIVQTLPVFFLKPMDSRVLKNENVSLIYQLGDEEGAIEVFELLNLRGEEIQEKMDYELKEPVNVYLYKTQTQLAIREAGWITLAVAPSWYIGDSHKGNIMMVSPNTTVEGHTHDTILNAALHELVHAIMYHINPGITYFWDNGMATYLSNQKPDTAELKSREFPSLEDMHTENGLKYGEMGGYAFSYNYIEFLDKTYGWDKVVSFASGDGSYEDIFGESEEEIYERWNTYWKL